MQFHYTLTESGTDFSETSYGGHPVAYLHGYDNILGGLEKVLSGLKVGDTVSVTLPPEDAYGLRDPSQIQKSNLKPLKGAGRTLKVGAMAWVQTEKGPRQVTVIKPGLKLAEVDTNHPLSGKTLTFDLQVVSVRDATDDEQSHGHAHGDGGHHH